MEEECQLESTLRFLAEPASRWTGRDFDALLRWAVEVKASDVKILPRVPVTARVNGRWYRATRRPVQTSEIMELLTNMTRSEVPRARVASGSDFDFSYEVPLTQIDPTSEQALEQGLGRRVRFRGNATGCRDRWSLGAEITLRLIADEPPPMSAIGLADSLYRSTIPYHNGLTLFTGITGTGKTTSMASILREINRTHPWAIATYEQPIEYDLSAKPDAMGPLTQSEIPTHFKSFEAAASNAVRRAEDLVLVGEARGEATLDLMLMLAEQGHRVFSTSHTKSVAATPLRIISEFDAGQHSHAAAALFSVTHTVIQQRLVTRTDPETGNDAGRIALREYLEFDAGMRSRLLRSPLGEVGIVVEELVRRHGWPLIEDARALRKEGLIAQSTLDAIEYEYRDREAELKRPEPEAAHGVG